MELLFQAPDDGCRYFSPEEFGALTNCPPPAEFDTSVIKQKLTDVRYGTLESQLLDIYFPDEGEGPYPVIFYVHGGGWTGGAKTFGGLPCIVDAIRSGYAVIAVDYRLAPEVKFPEFLYDVKTAVRWARAHADEYGFDAGRFAMVGDSAGGHLTLMAGFTADDPEYEGYQYGWSDYSSSLQALCAMYAPADLSVEAAEWFRESQVKRFPFIGIDDVDTEAFGTKDKELLKKYSPISHVHKDIPPTMLQHGTEDGMVPYQNSVVLADEIEKVCGKDRVLFKLYPGRNHSDSAFLTTENCREVLEFLESIPAFRV